MTIARRPGWRTNIESTYIVPGGARWVGLRDATDRVDFGGGNEKNAA